MQQRESAKKAAASAVVAAVVSSGQQPGVEGGHRNPITQTAAWLDRAKSALNDEPDEDEASNIQNQMHEVQQLIQEGPVIQQASAGLPQILDDEATQAAAAITVNEAGEVEPADKRLRTTEDAEALVGFLRSVRASAASGENL
jgi:hypothetical protein